MRKRIRAEQDPRRVKEETTRTTEVFVRWALVRPIDFEGEDTSLTQAELAVLK